MNKTMQKIADAVSCRKSMTNGNYSVRCSAEGRHVVVRYHSTDVVIINGDSAVLNTGGWATPTTKNVINAALRGAGFWVSVYQENFDWYVGNHFRNSSGLTRSFRDGMEILI